MVRTVGTSEQAGERMAPVGDKRTIGVIGGMGPLATADLYRKIVEATPAVRDQEHLHVIIDADPTVPDRTAALLSGGPDPLPHLIAAARRLEAAGAHLLIMPCNTAHAFLPAIQTAVRLPFIDMIRATAERAAEEAGASARIGVMATAGTVRIGLYDRAMADVGLSVRYPDEIGQRLVSDGIAQVKGGNLRAAAEQFVEAATGLSRDGCDLIVAGCTEIPIALDPSRVPVPLLDPTLELAKAAVAWALDPGATPRSLVAGDAPPVR